VNDSPIKAIEEMTCVVFDQQFEHDGMPFLASDKIFLRTELIVEDKHLQSNPLAGSLFNQACYMTTQTVFQEELAAFTHQCYEAANAQHWGIEKEIVAESPFIAKRIHALGGENHRSSLRFITNGFEYWFPKFSDVDEGRSHLKECTMIALLDFFNCKVNYDDESNDDEEEEEGKEKERMTTRRGNSFRSLRERNSSSRRGRQGLGVETVGIRATHDRHS